MNLDITPFKATCTDSLLPVATIQPSVLLSASTTSECDTTLAPSVLCRLPGCTCMSSEKKKKKSPKMTPRATRSHVRTRKDPAPHVSLSWPDGVDAVKGKTAKGKKASTTTSKSKSHQTAKDAIMVKTEPEASASTATSSVDTPSPPAKKPRKKRAKTVSDSGQGALIWPEMAPVAASSSNPSPRKKVKIETSGDAEVVSTATSQDVNVPATPSVSLPPAGLTRICSLPHQRARSTSYASYMASWTRPATFTRAQTSPTTLPSYPYHQHNLYYYDAQSVRNRYPTSNVRSSPYPEQDHVPLVVLPKLIADLPPPPGPKKTTIEPRPWRSRSDPGWPWWDGGALAP